MESYSNKTLDSKESAKYLNCIFVQRKEMKIKEK